MPCRNKGTCMPSADGFQCFCQPGFRGRTCTEDVDECIEDRDLCHNGGTCHNLNGNYTYDKASYFI